MIELIDVNKSYGTNTVLNGITKKFNKGFIYGVVGENGSGKTTLFKCISGLLHHNGTIKSDHTPLKNYTGFLETEPFFFSKMTGYEYLRLLSLSRDFSNPKLIESNIFNLPLEQYCSTYSTGMKKKLALMGVLLRRNEYLILDEPFNGVDIQSNLMIVEIIRKLKTLNKTIILSSHIFSTLNKICDEIIYLKRGVFYKEFLKSDFSALENEMKDVSIDNMIKNLDLGYIKTN